MGLEIQGGFTVLLCPALLSFELPAPVNHKPSNNPQLPACVAAPVANNQGI
jgi:hypothetical protein